MRPKRTEKERTETEFHHDDIAFIEEKFDNPPLSVYRFKGDTTTEPETLFYTSSEDEYESGSLGEQEKLRRLPSEDRVESDTEIGPVMLHHVEVKLISHEQLATEVDKIYDGLVMLEEKCIELVRNIPVVLRDRDPSKDTDAKIAGWQLMIECHKMLINEHHDFLLASQHHSARPELRKRITSYFMLPRLWRHGIVEFLQALEQRQPELQEQMKAFVHIAYSMVALLYETVPVFRDIWVQLLGIIAAYRIAVNDEDSEVWRIISYEWGGEWAAENSHQDLSYHYLAMLTRTRGIKQLSLYPRSLTILAPFEPAGTGMMTMINKIGSMKQTAEWKEVFINAHAALFKSNLPKSRKSSRPIFDALVDTLASSDCFNGIIAKAPTTLAEFGAFVAVSNIAALFEYGSPMAKLRLAYVSAERIKENSDINCNTTLLPENQGLASISQSSTLASKVLEVWLGRKDDRDIDPLVHIYLVFIWSLITTQKDWKAFEEDMAWRVLERALPWSSLCRFLNYLESKRCTTSIILAEDFPRSGDEHHKPLPEDFVLQGQIYSQWYFPSTWFTHALVEDDKRTPELPCTSQARIERIQWLGHRIASDNRWIRFDMNTKSFTVTDDFSDMRYDEIHITLVSDDYDTNDTDVGRHQ